jgi:hypothetical protein
MYIGCAFGEGKYACNIPPFWYQVGVSANVKSMGLGLILVIIILASQLGGSDGTRSPIVESRAEHGFIFVIEIVIPEIYCEFGDRSVHDV